MPKRIAIIGAGLSGLAAAFRLAESDAQLCLFEKSKGISGRAASRTKNGCRFDHGANYFKIESDEVARLLFQSLPTEGLCRIMGDIDTFDESGTIAPGDPGQNAAAKWTYRDGISTLGKLMVERAGLKVTGETLICRMERSNAKWHLKTESGATFGDFDAVLVTLPAPQTIGLLEASDFDPRVRQELVGELKEAEYHCQFTVVLNFHGELSLPGEAYALINADRRHDIAWLSHENRKPGRVPEGESLFIVQMSPAWSLRNYECPRDEIVAIALAKAVPLLGADLRSLNWSDSQRWRYAHPIRAAAFETMRQASPLGLFFAGDTFVGKGRVSGAIETGFVAARDIVESFGKG